MPFVFRTRITVNGCIFRCISHRLSVFVWLFHPFFSHRDSAVQFYRSVRGCMRCKLSLSILSILFPCSSLSHSWFWSLKSCLTVTTWAGLLKWHISYRKQVISAEGHTGKNVGVLSLWDFTLLQHLLYKAENFWKAEWSDTVRWHWKILSHVQINLIFVVMNQVLIIVWIFCPTIIYHIILYHIMTNVF